MADTTKETKSGKKGREHYSHEKADARIAKRREEADIRQAKHDALTTKEKIAKATKRGGSVRELKRLNALLEKEKEAKKAPKVEITESTESPKPKKKPYQKIKRS